MAKVWGNIPAERWAQRNHYSKEILEQWIREYENRRTQKAGKDDGHDR